MKSGKVVLDATTKARVPNPHFLRQPHTNKNFLWTVRQRMMHRYKVHKDDPDLSRPDADKEGASDDDDGSDPDKGPASDGSADVEPAEAARLEQSPGRPAVDGSRRCARSGSQCSSGRPVTRSIPGGSACSG